MKSLKKSLGLREQIAQAETKDEVQMLLGQSRVYDHASPQTRRRWENTARTRLKQLDKKDATTLAHVSVTKPHANVGQFNNARKLVLAASLLAI